MPESWYRVAGPAEPLTQGDLIFDCPALSWKPSAFRPEDGSILEELAIGDHLAAESMDLVVMTQACDLEHGKVGNVVLCPHYGLEEFKAAWEDDQWVRGQNPTVKGWRRYCDDICEGSIWNLSLLDAQSLDDMTVDHRIVDFHEVGTLPRVVLESLLRARGKPRPQLLPPYREHLSQAFARFFMRVGLPTPVTRNW